MKTPLVPKIDKKEFDFLFSDEISKKKYDEIISKIENRTNYIVRKFSTKCEWWDFDNLGYESEKAGYFNPESYKEYIGYSGELSVPSLFEYCEEFPTNNCPEFPTRWLWEDFEKEIEDKMSRAAGKKEEIKNRQKQKRLDRKQKLISLKESITSKLSKEELKAIKFKI